MCAIILLTWLVHIDPVVKEKTEGTVSSKGQPNDKVSETADARVSFKSDIWKRFGSMYYCFVRIICRLFNAHKAS